MSDIDLDDILAADASSQVPERKKVRKKRMLTQEIAQKASQDVDESPPASQSATASILTVEETITKVDDAAVSPDALDDLDNLLGDTPTCVKSKRPKKSKQNILEETNLAEKNTCVDNEVLLSSPAVEASQLIPGQSEETETVEEEKESLTAATPVTVASADPVHQSGDNQSAAPDAAATISHPSEFARGRIRFKDLGPAVQQLLTGIEQQGGSYDEEDVHLLSEFVSVKDMARIFDEMQRGVEASVIWEFLKKALLVRKDKRSKKAAEFYAKEAEIEARERRERECDDLALDDHDSSSGAKKMHPLQVDGEQKKPDTTAGNLESLQLGGCEELPAYNRNDGALDRKARKLQVLKKYTADDKAILSNVIQDEAELTEADRHAMKVARLEHMSQNDGEDGHNESQFELINVIEKMNDDINAVWEKGQRVQAVRIAVRATKLILQTKVAKCYPSLFVITATVLDTFGDLVAARILQTALENSPIVAGLIAQGVEPDPSVIPEEAISMCNNWFLKIMSIRELLPRVYVELSLLESYKFVAHKFRINSMEALVQRMGQQLRGSADPLASVYARWFLCTRAEKVLKASVGDHWGETFIPICHDAFDVVSRLSEVKGKLGDMDQREYADLFTPALQWLIDTIAAHSSYDAQVTFVQVTLDKIETTELSYSSAVHLLLSAFSPEMLLPHVERFLAILDSGMSCTRECEIISAMAHMVAENPRPFPWKKNHLKKFLDHLWKRVASDVSPEIDSMSAIIRATATHGAFAQLNGYLNTFSEVCLTACKVETTTKKALSMIFMTLASIIRATPDPISLFGLEALLRLISRLSAERRQLLCKALLCRVPPESYSVRTSVLEICRQIHDWLPDQVLPQHSDAVSPAITRALRNIFFTGDVEKYLNFICECRHTLSKLDSVKITLVHESLRLFMHVAKSTPAGDDRSAARACLAYCHSTVPGITNVFHRLRCGMTIAETALHYGFIGQGEAMMLLCTKMFEDFPTLTEINDRGSLMSNEQEVVTLLVQFLVMSVPAPPHPRYGPLYGVRAVLSAAAEMKWPSTGAIEVGMAAANALRAVRSGAFRFVYAGCPNIKQYSLRPEYASMAKQLTDDAIELMSRTAAAGPISCRLLEVALPLSSVEPAAMRLAQSALAQINSGIYETESTVQGVEAFIAWKDRVVQWAKQYVGDEVYQAMVRGTAYTAPLVIEDNDNNDDDDIFGEEDEVVATYPQDDDDLFD